MNDIPMEVINFLSKLMNMSKEQVYSMKAIDTLNSRIESLEEISQLVFGKAYFDDQTENKFELCVPSKQKESIDRLLAMLADRENSYFKTASEDCIRNGYPISEKKIKEYYFNTYKDRYYVEERKQL